MPDTDSPLDEIKYWSDYEVQKPDGSWTTIGQLLQREVDLTVINLRKENELYCHKQVIEELRNARAIYDKMESSNESTESWRHWKGVRNVLTDRIEELTGKRN